MLIASGRSFRQQPSPLRKAHPGCGMVKGGNRGSAAGKLFKRTGPPQFVNGRWL